MTTHNYKVVESLRFDSLGSCLNYAESVSTPENYLNCHTYSSDPGMIKWAGGSFNTAVYLARTGWQEGLKLIRKSEDLIVAKLNAGGDIVRSLSESGDEVDVGLFLEGDPEHMASYPIGEGRKPVVKLVVSIGASSGISNETITMRGAAICAAVDAVESAGLRVEIVVDFTSAIGHKFLSIAEFRVTVKKADDSLDRDKIAYVLMHPTMLRQIAFRLMESKPTTNPTFVQDMYGFPANPIKDDKDAVYLGCMHLEDTRWHTTDSAVAATKQLIEQLSAKSV